MTLIIILVLIRYKLIFFFLGQQGGIVEYLATIFSMSSDHVVLEVYRWLNTDKLGKMTK